MTNVVSNQASVVLLVPVAVDVAGLGANAFAFVLAVTFAASTAFMTPVGYQTNLFVYGPGKYQFSDFIRVGGPLQLLLVVVTTGVSSSGASDRSRAVSCACSSRQPIPRTPRYSTPVQQIRTPMPAFRTVDDLDTGQRLLMRIDVNAPVEASVGRDDRHAETIRELLDDDHALDGLEVQPADPESDSNNCNWCTPIEQLVVRSGVRSDLQWLLYVGRFVSDLGVSEGSIVALAGTPPGRQGRRSSRRQESGRTRRRGRLRGDARGRRTLGCGTVVTGPRSSIWRYPTRK